MRNKLSMLAISCLLTTQIFSEIELVTVTWAQGFCTNECENSLNIRLRTIPQIAEFLVKGGAAEVAMRWKPRAKFSYSLLNTIIKGAGIKTEQVFIRIRGTIQHDYNNTYLVSLGDDTRFILLSPINVGASPNQAVARHNIDAYKLSPQMKDKLATFEVESRVVTVDGVLFDPWRYVDLYVIVKSATTPPFK